MNQDHNSNGLWEKVFNIDSQSGTSRLVALAFAFVLVGGTLSWLIG